MAVTLAAIFAFLKILTVTKNRGSAPRKGEKGEGGKADPKEPDTTQALFGKETVVSPEGIVEINGTYRVCLYVSQVNMRTNTDLEKYKVWTSFRNFLNEVGMPFTLVQLSQFVDIREYALNYRDQLGKGHLTPELAESGLNVARFIESMDENRNSRDYHGYITFHYDPDSDSIDSGVATGNARMDEVMSKLTGKKRMPEGERKNLARMMLQEAANITRNYAEQMGMQCRQLNRGQVYGLAYKILQKDYASFSSPEEASQAQCFTAFYESETAKDLVLEFADEEEGVS
ncbi:hypothetical protein CEB3_c21180 [Peptococcaceae bacterium CEB3]|nr:hypothetical protein CEB3_c21180 [Peptococcaceae bacterium CEB3]